MTTGGCQFTQALVDQTPSYGKGIKKNKKAPTVLAKGGFYRKDLRMRKKLKFL